MRKRIIIDGNSLSIENVVAVARGNAYVALSAEAKRRVMLSRKTVEKWVSEHRKVYGITTGFGPMCDRAVAMSEVRELQENLIRSHSAGFGNPFPRDIVRAIMCLRANVLAKGYSGVRVRLLDTLMSMINRSVHPVIPETGSVGASGDLVPLAHMALPMMGEGNVEYNGHFVQADSALRKEGIDKIRLDAKEGIALINGTSVMTALGALACYDSLELVKEAEIAASMSIEALNGAVDAFDERIHLLRPHKGQIESAENFRKLLSGSQLVSSLERATRKQSRKESREIRDIKLQDAYSLRCSPQVYGAVRDAIAFARKVIEIEMNSATDNPLILSKSDEALHGGNFHGQPVASAMDMLSISLTSVGNISERRTARLLDSSLNEGLPLFLVRGKEGVQMGLMGTQYTATSLAAENRTLACPASIQSLPTNANNQDIVSMGTIAARNASKILSNVQCILAIEMISAAQAIDLRGPGKLAKGTIKAYRMIRRIVPPIVEDRGTYVDIAKLIEILRNGELVRAVESSIGRLN